MAKACKIKYEGGFNQTKLNNYNKFFDYLLGEQIRFLIKNGLFISLGTTINSKTGDALYNSMKAQLQLILADQSDVIKIDNESTKEDLQHILDNYDFFKNYHRSNSHNRLDSGDIDTEDTSESNESSDATQIKSDLVTTNGWDRSDFKVRMLFMSLPKHKLNKDKIPEIVINPETGLPQMAEGVSLFNILSKELSNLPTPEAFYSKINSADFRLRFPDIEYILSLLPSKDNTDLDSTLMHIAFYTSLNKAYIPLSGVKSDDEGNIFPTVFSTNNETNIGRKWENNFEMLSSNPSNEKYLWKQFQTNKNVLKALPKIEYDDNIKSDKIESFLELLGIKLSQQTYDASFEEIKNIMFGDKGLYKNIHDIMDYYNSTDRRLSNPMLLRKDSNIEGSIKSQVYTFNSRVKDLLALESKFSELQPSTTYINPNGDKQSAISEKNSIVVMMDYINYSDSLEELFSYLPQLEKSTWFHPTDKNGKLTFDPKQIVHGGSFWFNTIFNSKGLKNPGVRLELHNFTGNNNTSDKSSSKTTSRMNEREKLIMDLNSAGEVYQFINIPRTSTSDTYYAIRLTKNGKQSPQILNDKSDFNSDIFEDQMINLLNKELYRIANPSEQKKYQDFFIFNDILSDDLKKKLLDNPKYQYTLEEIKPDIDAYFNKELSDLKDIIKKYNIEPKNLLKKYSKLEGSDRTLDDTALLNFIKSYFLNSVEFTNFFVGDPIYFKDYHKRIKGGLSTGVTAEYKQKIEDYLSNPTNFVNNYTIAALNGYERRDNSKTLKVKSFDDSLPKQEPLITKIISNLSKLGPVSNKLKANLNKAYNDNGKGLNVADGQGLINMDFYREFLMRTGNWSQEKEETFLYEGLFYKKNVLKQPLTELEAFQFNEIEENINKDSKGLYSLPPLKAQMLGPYANIDKYALAMDKFSLVPILPTVAYHNKNSEWTKVLNDFSKHGIAYAKYESAAKGYKFNVTPFGTGYNKFEEVSTDLLKEQIRTASELKQLVTWGTQFRKLLFSGFFDSENASPKIKELYNRYISQLKDIAQDSKETLNKDLGIILDIDASGKSKITIEDFSKFISKLQDQALKLNVSNNILDSIEYNPDTKELVNAFETSGSTNIVMNMLFGMIDKKLRVLKTTGNQYIQVSNDTFEALDFYDLISNRTTPATVRISLTGEYKKLLNLKWKGERIGTIERLNTLMKNSEFRKANDKSLTVIGYRIPTQELNSMEHVKIVEFLPPTSGNIIQLYDEITGKSGSDFDIDKLSVFLPSFDNDGNYLDEAYKLRITNELKQLEETYSELRNLSNDELFTEDEDGNDIPYDSVDKLFNDIFGQKGEGSATEDIPEITDALNTKYKDFKRYIELKTYNKNYLTNSLLELYSEIFSQPEAYAQLVRPNSADIVNDIFKNNYLNSEISKDKKTGKLKPYQDGLPTKTSVFSYVTNLFVHAQLKISGKHLAIYTVANTSHAQATQLGLNINKNYVKSSKDGFVVKNVQLGLLTPEERKKLINPDGTINMGYNYDVEGQSIQEIISQLINVTVDPEKNPQYIYSNINDKNISMVLYLLRQGVPFERIIDFISLRPIKYYFEQLNNSIPKGDVLKELYGKYNVSNPDEVRNDITLFSSEDDIKKLKQQVNNPTDLDFLQKAIVLMLRSEKESDMFRDFTQHFNYDTSKLVSPISALKKAQDYNLIMDTGFIHHDTIKKWKTNSIVSNFDNLDFIQDISEKLFPIIFKRDTVKNFVSTINKTKLTKIKSQSLEKVIIQDFIQAIVETYGEYKGIKLGDYSKLLLTDDELNVMTRLVNYEVPDKYSYYNIFQLLSGEVNRGIKNIKILRDLDNKTSQINMLTEELETLINSDDLITSELFKDLSILAMKQGLSKSRFFLEDIVPLSFKQDIYHNAIDRYQSDDNKDSFYDDFEIAFIKNMKDKYFPKMKTLYSDFSGRENTINQNPYANFMKDYSSFINPTTYENLSPEEKTSSEESKIDYPDITNVSKSSKKQRVTLTLEGKEPIDVDAYKITISEHPDFSAWMYKTDSTSKNWIVVPEKVQRVFPLEDTKTIESTLQNLKESINSAKNNPTNLKILQETGLFTEKSNKVDPSIYTSKLGEQGTLNFTSSLSSNNIPAKVNSLNLNEETKVPENHKVDNNFSPIQLSTTLKKQYIINRDADMEQEDNLKHIFKNNNVYLQYAYEDVAIYFTEQDRTFNDGKLSIPELLTQLKKDKDVLEQNKNNVFFSNAIQINKNDINNCK